MASVAELGRQANERLIDHTSCVIRVVGVCVAAVLVVCAAGGAARDAKRLPLHRSCPPGNKRTPYPPVQFDVALAQAKRALYGRRVSAQGQTYVLGPRNTSLAAVMRVQNLALVPGMQRWYAAMERRCGSHTPYLAWAFQFDVPTIIAGDFSPMFVVRGARAWYVF
jgi:hypothetical protein